MAFRYDSGSLGTPRKLASGGIRVDAYLARTGVLEYLNPDGSTRRELVLAEELFRTDSLDSARGAPVTDEHPDAMLTADNAMKHARGTVMDDVRADGPRLRASVTVMDAALIKAMKGGKVQVSCGYSCDIDPTPGVWQGERYDVVQRNRVYNHVAVVDRGRAGAEVRARMDAAMEIPARNGQVGGDAEGVEAALSGRLTQNARSRHDNKETHGMETVTIKINGVDYTVDKQVAQAVEAERTSSRADAAKALSKAEADRDAHKERADKAEKARTDAAEHFDAAVTARAALISLAGTHGVEAKGTDHDVRLAIVEKLGVKIPEAKRADAVYVEARLDAALEDASADKLAAGRKASTDASKSRADGGEGDHFDALEKAKARAAARAQNRGIDPEKEGN